MQAFEYAAPETMKDALSLLSASWGETDILAGGTDLLSLMKERIHTPKRVVSLKNLKELKGVTSGDSGLRIGALTTLRELLANGAVQKSYGSLVAAANGTPPVSNFGLDYPAVFWEVTEVQTAFSNLSTLSLTSNDWKVFGYLVGRGALWVAVITAIWSMYGYFSYFLVERKKALTT